MSDDFMALSADISKVIEENGYFPVEVKNIEQERQLRIVISSQKGISHQDCINVSRVVNSLLEGTSFEDYSLEIASPGSSRRMKNHNEVAFFIDRNISVKLVKVDGKSQVQTGVNKGFSGDDLILLNPEGEQIIIPRIKIKVIKLINE